MGWLGKVVREALRKKDARILELEAKNNELEYRLIRATEDNEQLIREVRAESRRRSEAENAMERMAESTGPYLYSDTAPKPVRRDSWPWDGES